MKLQLLIVALIALGTVVPASGHHTRYTADLTGPAVSPPNNSPAIGHIVVTMDFDLITMQIETEFSSLQGSVTEAHIHAPTPAALSGIAGIATQVPTLMNFPSGVTTGSYDEVFDLTLESSYNPAFFAASGVFPSDAFNALVLALDQGKAYFDIHSSAYPDGEIRGFLVHVPGDYNDNGIVDAADYVMWRKTFGTTGEGLKADSNNDNEIGDEDYTAWRENFGHFGLSSTPGSGAAVSSNIPEPGAFALVAIALLAPFRVRSSR